MSFNYFSVGGEAKIFIEFAAGSRGEMERDRTAAADRVRDQELRSGVHLGEDQEEVERQRVGGLQHFRQQHGQES